MCRSAGLGGTRWVGGGLRADNRSQGCSALPAGDCSGSGVDVRTGGELLRGHGVSLCVPFSPSRAESVSPVEGERNAEGLLLVCWRSLLFCVFTLFV